MFFNSVVNVLRWQEFLLGEAGLRMHEPEWTARVYMRLTLRRQGDTALVRQLELVLAPRLEQPLLSPARREWTNTHPKKKLSTLLLQTKRDRRR